MSDYVDGGIQLPLGSDVVVGLNKDIGIPVSSKTFSRTFIILSVVFTVGFFAIVISISFYTWFINRPQFPPSQPESNDNVGSFSGESDGSGLSPSTCGPNTLIDGRCVCRDGWYGDRCDKQLHDPNFFSLGTPYGSTSYSPLYSATLTKKQCGETCKSISDCNGFVYNGGVCTLLSNVIVGSGSTIGFDESTDSSIYLNSRDNLHFENKVFIGKYEISLPSRFWTIQSTETYQQLTVGQVTSIEFVPRYLKSLTHHTGFYAPFEFRVDQLESLTRNSARIYIHDTNLPLNPPSSWEGKKIWVVYV